MNNKKAYNTWAENYDTIINKTRDVEYIAIREMLSFTAADRILEIGCGTGKNTEWLLTKAINIVGVDFSDEMLSKARNKIKADNVKFIQFDIRESWNFEVKSFDLITCSLVLEHIEDLNFIFQQAEKVLKPRGLFYIGELHPFKQYQGSKARFDTKNGVIVLECFTHHISDFFKAAKDNNFSCFDLREWFDDNDKTIVPRLLAMIFKKT